MKPPKPLEQMTAAELCSALSRATVECWNVRFGFTEATKSRILGRVEEVTAEVRRRLVEAERGARTCKESLQAEADPELQGARPLQPPEGTRPPTLEELQALAIDITGGEDAADYVRRMRSGNLPATPRSGERNG